ncbi:hypothetical protein GCM10009425_40500 [Pseudomonas asuensis]|uniref:Uncharacterized protein n=2 Tax=Pseudomonas asuensis TaxID=1825787 RepID=A0ABQ2H2E9_9PSED|nr:hypothetical protein GCM10009425_40500 [Pseudomonas asuensis]
MKSPIPGAFSALYGYQSKQEGFMAARQYADKNRLQFTVIDFLVKLDQKQNPLMMKPGDIPRHDFLSFQRLSRNSLDEVEDILRNKFERDGSNVSGMDLSKPHHLIMQRPELIQAVMSASGWEHLKVLAFPAKSAVSERPLTVGVVPYEHWSAIQEASCRLHPNIRITLDSPSSSDKQISNQAPQDIDADRSKGPKMR